METKRALTGTKTSQGFSLYYRNTKLTACCGVIGRVRESRNPKKVIRVALMESYGEIGRVPVNLYRIQTLLLSSYHFLLIIFFLSFSSDVFLFHPLFSASWKRRFTR